jgi:SAM-dependent methyltransferase
MTQPLRNLPVKDAYREIAPFYDMTAPSNVEAILGFWDFAIARHSGRPDRDVLEFACGTGRVLLPLAQRGHRVVGTDASQPMLEISRKRAEGLRQEVVLLRHERMEDFHEPDSYDALLAVFGAIAFLTEDHSVRQFFKASFEALRPGGLLLVDVPNALHGLISPPREVVSGVFREGEVTLERFLLQVPNPLEGTTTYHETGIVHGPTGFHVVQAEYRLRLYTLAELRLLLEPTRFRRVTCYCDWDHREPMQPPYPRLILVLEKPGE